MAVQFVQSADCLDYKPTSAAVTAGSPVVIGEMLGFTKYDIPKDELGTIHLSGVFANVPKTTGTALTAGQVVFWQTSSSKIVAAAATGAFACGYAVEAAASAADTCTILLVNGANLKKTS